MKVKDGKRITQLTSSYRGVNYSIRMAGFWDAGSEIYKYYVTIGDETGVYPATQIRPLQNKVKSIILEEQ